MNEKYELISEIHLVKSNSRDGIGLLLSWLLDNDDTDGSHLSALGRQGATANRSNYQWSCCYLDSVVGCLGKVLGVNYIAETFNVNVENRTFMMKEMF